MLDRLTISLSSTPAQMPTLSLSGYVVALGQTIVDHISTRAGSSASFQIL